jgi:hypothetical protein
MICVTPSLPCARAALKKALQNGPAPPGAFDNKGGFDSYSQHAQVHYAQEVNGVVVGYQGHVPRARDTVGTCPLGKVPGTPVSETGFVGIDMEKSMDTDEFGNYKIVRVLQPPGTDFKQYYRGQPDGDLSNYTSEARDPQNMKNKMAPKMHGQGTTPGYTGHVPRVKTHSLGSTTHSMPPPDPSRASKNDGYSGKNDETRFFQTNLVKGPDSQFAAGQRGSVA